MKQKIIWCVQHNPVELLLRVARDFADILNTYTDKYEIEVLTQKEYADYYNNGVFEDTLDLVHQNKVQISQTFTYKLAYLSSAFNALDMPYLFRDHDHAQRVLEGPIGTGLLNSLKKEGRELKGLAFTYSGGYRIFCSDQPISGLDDLKGRRVMISPNPLAIDTVSAMGAEAEPGDVHEVRNNWFEGRSGLISETTWVRYQDWLSDYAPYVLDAQHSLFLTTLIANVEFWESLPAEDRVLFEKAAQQAASNEKKFTIAEAERLREQAAELDNQIVVLNEQEIDQVRAMVQPVINKWQTAFIPNLIEAIRAS